MFETHLFHIAFTKKYLFIICLLAKYLTLKAVDETNRQSFQGGDAAWESEKLGRYENRYI